jgi:hypothetical protein
MYPRTHYVMCFVTIKVGANDFEIGRRRQDGTDFGQKNKPFLGHNGSRRYAWPQTLTI